MSSALADALKAGRFVVTSELTPPKGTDLGPLFAKADMLAERVDAFNLTDSPARACRCPRWRYRTCCSTVASNPSCR